MLKSLFLISIFTSNLLLSQNAYNYPESRKVVQIDTFFNQAIEDPYRWLEDQQSEETKKWVAEQNKFAKNYLQKIPNNFTLREQIKRNTQISYRHPTKSGDYYFELRQAFGGTQMKVYYTKDIRVGYWDELFISKDLGVKKGETFSISGFYMSKNSQYMAYSFDNNGSDWKEIKVADLTRQKNLDDHLYNVKHSSIDWRGNGFYYQRFEKDKNGNEYKQEAKNPMLYYHKLGTSQEEDSLIFKRSDAPYNFFSAWVSDDEQYLIIEDCNQNTNMRSFYYVDFNDPVQKGILPLIKKTGKVYRPLYAKGNELTFLESYYGEKKIVSINTKNPAKHTENSHLNTELILRDAIYHKGYYYEVCYFDQQQYLIVLSENSKIIKKVEIPFGASCSITGVDENNNELLLTYQSYLHPPVLASMKLSGYKFEVIEPVKISYSMEDFVIEKITYKSDTAVVPMLIIHNKHVKLDGNNPVLIEFYGGYRIIHDPEYDAGRISFLENGGIYAYAMIRGGGEKGHYWHKDGRLLNRQKSINDIINAAQFFIDKGYTQAPKIAITGTSHGGLMAAAAAMQRPDLFAAVVPVVGVYDMLRFEKFTIGSVHLDEYGTIKKSLDYLNLRSFSPLHNVQKGLKYPATLFMTADYDDRVPPLHSYKMTATMQTLASGENPVLLIVEKNAGHNGARTYEKYIDKQTDFYSFILNALGVKKFK
ncbi:MAG: prolyl oligopeptidase family serine peptidase [Bacteroidota bacterium]